VRLAACDAPDFRGGHALEFAAVVAALLVNPLGAG
jgi:hypothetical protein